MDPSTTAVPDAPTMRRWFAHVDEGDVTSVLSLLAGDFRMSMQLSRGDGTSVELTGGTAELAGYLRQRGRADLEHETLSAAAVGLTEHVLGRTRTREGDVVSSFSATARLVPACGLVHRLLVCRTAALRFADA